MYRQPFSWRWFAAAGLFLCGFLGLLAGTPLSERPDVVDAGMLTKAYYALGFFVIGGLDVGTPIGGPIWAQTILWVAYFGAPLLAASTVIDAIFQVLSPSRWQLRNIKNHVIVFGSGRLTIGYLRLLKRHSPRTKVVVVDKKFDPVREQELRQKYRARTIVGDLTHSYLLENLRLKKARRVLLLGDNDFQAYEAASRILQLAPRLNSKVVLHCHNLRFMRSLQGTALSGKCEVFNTYNLAAQGFVKGSLLEHFERTAAKDTVVIAGFGRFGQSILEELQGNAKEEIEEVTVVDVDADRRVLVVEEQDRLHYAFKKNVFEGDISHPEVWRRVTDKVDLGSNSPTVILGTGQEQDNLRTALWIKARFKNALVFARTDNISRFALEVGAEHGINSISITQLVENSIPEHWLNT